MLPCQLISVTPLSEYRSVTFAFLLFLLLFLTKGYNSLSLGTKDYNFGSQWDFSLDFRPKALELLVSLLFGSIGYSPGSISGLIGSFLILTTSGPFAVHFVPCLRPNLRAFDSFLV